MVSRRFRALIHVLIAAQVLSFSTIASSMPSSSGSTAGPDCAAMMQFDEDTGHCPCCPEGLDNIAACLSACLPLLGALPTPLLSIAGAKAVAPPMLSVPSRPTASDPPLTPPPIR